MKLFEVIVITKRTEDEVKKGAKPVILLDTKVFSTDDRGATIEAILDNKDKIGERKFHEIEVLVRPFA